MIALILAAALAADTTAAAMSIGRPDTHYIPRVQECWTPLDERPPSDVRAPVGGCVWTPRPDTDRLGAKILPSVAIDMTGALAVADPPCGTPEAKEAGVCLLWKVVPCGPRQTVDPKNPWRGDWARPLGCDP